MIQYYYTKKEWGVVMEKEELKILEELRRILNSKNEAIVILNNYFKGGVGRGCGRFLGQPMQLIQEIACTPQGSDTLTIS